MLAAPPGVDPTLDRPASMRGAVHMYGKGYRITHDGYLRVPGARLEVVDGVLVSRGYAARPITGSAKEGPTTYVLVPIPGQPHKHAELRVKLVHLAVACFYGPHRLVSTMQLRYRDKNKTNLSRDNVRLVGVKHPEVEHGELPDTRPDLRDQKMWRVLLYALENHITTIEEAAKRLETTPRVVLTIANMAKSELVRPTRRAMD
jgi:hypothetical protein